MHYLESSFEVMEQTDLLQWLQSAKKTGVLRVSSGVAMRRIYLKDGSIIACSSNEPRLLLGQFMLSNGRLDEAALQEFMRLQERSGQNLGSLLVDAGRISQGELQLLLIAKAEEVLFSVLEQENGNFRFEPDKSPPEDSMSVELNVQTVLLEGVRRLDELERVRQIFRSPHVVLHRTEKAPDGPTIASYMGRKLYDSIDGRRTLAEIILLCRTSECLAGYFLLRLVERGLVRVGDARAPGTNVVRDESAVTRLRELVASGEYEEAVDLIDHCGLTPDGDEFLELLIAKVEAGFLANAYRTQVPPDAVPRLIRSDGVPSNREMLNSEDLFLLDMIDEHWDVRSLIWIAPMRKIEVVRGLLRLRDYGCIELRSVATASDAPAHAAPRFDESVEGVDPQTEINRILHKLGAGEDLPDTGLEGGEGDARSDRR
jgi:hypothetical protein